MERGTLTRVTKDFFTTKDGELSLAKGDYFLIHDVIDKHWYFGESFGRRGKFPSNYASRVDVPEVRPPEELLVTIATFRGEQHGDLSFGEGELVVGVRQVEENWFFGYIDTREGVFPLSHVWRLDPNILKQSDKKSLFRRARVKTSLQAQLTDELDLHEGEVVTILEVLEDGWVRGRTEEGKEGTFPEAFVSYLEEQQPEVENLGDQTSKMISSSQQPNMSQQRTYESAAKTAEEPAPYYYDLFPEIVVADPKEITNEDDGSKAETASYGNLNSLGVEPYAITLYPFKAQFPNELSFGEGEVVHLLGRLDSEWAEGTIEKARGYFPISYVNVIVDCHETLIGRESDGTAMTTTTTTASSTTASTTLAPTAMAEVDVKQQCRPEIGDVLRVEYTFEAQMEGDLSVSEGDFVTVFEIANDDWLSVRNAQGNVGLCPRAYLVAEMPASSEHDSLEDYVVVLREKKPATETNPLDKSVRISDTRTTRRLSEPHRPAPPAPAPGRTPLPEQNSQASSRSPPCRNDGAQLGDTSDRDLLEKRKRADKRQNVISELVITEKEYVRDLKLTYEIFELHNPCNLESRGIDVAVIFGNLLEVIHVAEELLDLVLRSMKGCDEDLQTIAPCFLNMSERMQTIYGKYCANHEAALSLLKKYEDNREIMGIFEKGIQTLRQQVVCFDMSSILIKPVQRILKYPLMLYELIKCTEETHPDRRGIEEAWKAMTQVASYINEYKRRKDLVTKYLDEDNTLMGKMSKLTMHSVAKKSSRLSAKLSATLGLTNLTIDPEFEELERSFKILEKCVWQLSKDVEQCMIFLEDEATCGEVLANLLTHYNTGSVDNETTRYAATRDTIRTRYLEDLKKCLEQRVNGPVNCLANLLEGPAVLITKRHDKLLDYDNAISRSDKNRDSKIAQDDLNLAKTNFEALNQQLLEELPVLVDAATSILTNCIGAFANARKLLSGRIVKCYFTLSASATQVSPQDILESFLVNHNLIWNQISRSTFGVTRSSSVTSLSSIDGPASACPAQTERQRATLRSRYPSEALYVTLENVASTSSLDLSAARGTLVAVIKQQDPMGDTRRWFVDNGAVQGFLASRTLQRCSTTTNHEPNVAIDDQPDLMSLDSPEKKKSFKDNFEERSSYSNFLSKDATDENSMRNANYDFFKAQQRYENVRPEFFHASFDFRQDREETLAITKGQALKLLKRHDDSGNEDWWLMEDRHGNTGYVPRNHLMKRG